uniref:TEP1-F n=1 Tax=Culicoides sonorensis TaxID=179676 RepID=A0A336LJG8_CULSO
MIKKNNLITFCFYLHVFTLFRALLCQEIYDRNNENLVRNTNNNDSNEIDFSWDGTSRDYEKNFIENTKESRYGGSRNRDRFMLNYNPVRVSPNLVENNNLNQETTYFIVASKTVRPGQIYRVSVSINNVISDLIVRGSISRDGVEMTYDSKEVKENVMETLLMRVPTTSVPGDYKLRIEGLYNSINGGIAFVNETRLTFSQRSMTVFIQTDKPVYMQGESVKFRVIPITTELKGFDNSIDVYMVDPNGHILRRWLSRHSNLGTVSLDYKLSDQPVYGEWTVRVVVQGQVEEHLFSVEEYYQTRFEVNVTMPSFFFNTDPFLYGKVMANFTSGAPVKGNLTLKATIRPIGYFNAKNINEYFRKGYIDHMESTENTDVFGSQRTNDYENYNRNNYNPTLDTNPDPRFGSSGSTYNDPFSFERHFNFDEEWPFWIEKPDQYEYNRWGDQYRGLPYLRFFNGTFEFKYSMKEIESLVTTLAGSEILITARVGERFYDEIIEGYAIARIYNSSIKVEFLGGSPQVIKPTMPITTYLVAEYHDGSPLPYERLFQSTVEVSASVNSRSGGRKEMQSKYANMSEKAGIWEIKLDLYDELNLQDLKNARDFLNDVTDVKLKANFIDVYGERISADLLLLSHYSPQNQQIKITTSTQAPKVGEYIVFHIHSNFYMESFYYMVMSKGIVLLTGQENMISGVQTMAITLSAEMAPTATIVIWHIGRNSLIVADSLTFPVNGISRNKFTVFINNRKARTGEKVEVAIFGEPGAYVGLSAIDNAFYTMQAGNELTYATVIKKMSTFDEQRNGTLSHTWYFHEGHPDELVYYPSSTFGIDANRTFEYAGLIVFTDGTLPRRLDQCNNSYGYAECLNGRCYRVDKRCDGFLDCEDGTDESGCQDRNTTLLAEFRKYRFNRIKRHYDNVWLWKDINIGPHGRYIFNLDVPDTPALWMISAFSVSPSLGFGMLTKPLEYVGVQPFYINVEMPTECRQGEQVGIRVTVFNYMTNQLEATVVLHESIDYKFVHVGEDGIVASYNPKTSYGEHQFFIYLEPQDSTVVYVPIVPTRLGSIDVVLHVSTLLGTDTIKRTLKVEADGLPQYRHQSILLDLSNRAYIFQYMHVNVTETPIIPYEVERYYVFGSNKARISIVGDVVGPIFPTMPVNATSLLYLPIDAGETNMFSFSANLYTILYMRLISQRNRNTEKQAFHYMNIGYQKQMSYMNSEGAMTLFRSDWNQSAPSVWLTAYCARVFQEASFYEWENFIYIDPIVIQKNVRWILKHQLPEGSFFEVTWSPDRKFNETARLFDKFGKYEQGPRNISLTAHVLITLVTVKDLSGSLGARVSLATTKAVQYIERSMPYLQEFGTEYEIAIVAYALILPYKYDALNIETTSYALLTYASRQELLVDSIVRWLNAQRLTDGGWASSQDTGVAMKALIEYTQRTRIRDVSTLSVTIEATSLPGETKLLEINDKNLAQLQSIEIPNAWGTVKVQAKGAGYAILQMSVQYNVDIEEFQTKPPITAFDLTTKTIFHGRNQSHIHFLSCQRWTNLNESIRSGMAVLDVTIPTGYWIQQQKLDAYVVSKRVRNLQRAKFNDKKVLFYFDYLDHEETCVNFTIERWYPVANMSRYLPIRVYDFYAPERFNETILDALPTYLLNICEVCGSSQCPYCSIYNRGVSYDF